MVKKQKIDFKYNLKVYLDFASKYKFLFLGILFVILVAEASIVADKFLFKWIIDQGASFSEGKLSQAGFVQVLLLVALLYVIIIIIRAVMKWLQLHGLNKLETSLIVDLKRKYFDHILHLSHSFHISHKTGSLISRLTRGGRGIEAMTDVVVFNSAPLIFQLVVAGVSLVYFDWMAMVVTVSTIVVFILYSLIFQLSQQNANLKANEAEDSEKGYIADVFTNIDSIKYFGKEWNIKKGFRVFSEKARLTLLQYYNFYRWLDFGQNLILGLGTFFLVWASLKKFLHGEMSLGTLVFVYTVFGSMMSPLYGFVHGMREFYRAMADFEYLFQYGKVENDIKDKPDAKELKIEEGTVDFDDITFSYNKRKLFNGFNLKIHKNEKVALVGHSGCGKTTLVKLLYRFYDVKGGAILVDDQNIQDFKQESLRSELSIVPQECVLFDDTIYNNIAFSRPGVSRKEVFRAMRFAQLDKFVRSLPKKELTIVGERGVKLSGGEKQRVSIARAILADKKILILDEATSSLDSRTEHEIQRDLQRLMKGRTSIIIAHRLSTIMRADKIVVIHKGKIVQMDKHDHLIHKKGEYQKLWKLQRGGYIT